MSLSELGAFLQRQREELGLSYADIEAQTRIRAKYLRAIEFGEWDTLPPGVYTRGLVKMYARALGVNASTAVRMYAKERPSEARLPEPQLMSRPLIRQPRLSFETLLSALVFVVAVGLLGWMLSAQLWPAVKRLASDGAAESTPAASPATNPTTTAPPIATARLGGTTTSATSAASAPTSATPSAGGTPTLAALGGTTVAQSTVAATSAATTTAGIVIQIEAVEDAWLSVYLDEAAKPAYYTFLKPGATPLRFEARALVRLRTGNAGGTKVSLNGRDAGSLGDKGDVKELQWRLAADGTIVQQEL